MHVARTWRMYGTRLRECTAQQHENTILKTCVKLVLLYQHGLLTARHFPGLVKAGDCLAVIADVKS